MESGHAKGPGGVAINSPTGDRKLLIALCLIWLLPRAIHLSFCAPFLHWEVWEAKKLLEYGFWNRWGAIINWHYMTGIRPDPWAFNYTNHPYPVLWLYTLLYYLAGPAGIYVAIILVWLVVCVVLYRVLSARFGRTAAWWACVLYCLSPNSIYYDTNPNSFASGAIIWPMALGALYLRSNAEQASQRFGPWLCGLAVVLAGQVSWFSLSAVPSLLWLTAPPNTPLKEMLQHPLKNPYWRAIIIGAFMTAGLFMLQIVVYLPSLKEFWRYFLQQCGSGPIAMSRLSMVPNIAAKTVEQIGPGLWLPTVAAVLWLFKHRSWDRLATGAGLLYLAVYAAIGLVLSQAYWVEASFLRYLLVPVTILATLGLDQIKRSGWRVLFLGLAVLSAAFTLVKAQALQPSPVALVIGQKVGEVTRPEDIVLTNLRIMAPPYAYWDTAAIEVTRRTADRLMRFDIQDLQRAREAMAPFSKESSPCAFVVEKSIPLSSDLKALLEKASAPPANCQMVLPPEPETIFIELRTLYWKFTKRFSVSEKSVAGRSAPATIDLQIYRLPSEVFKQTNHG